MKVLFAVSNEEISESIVKKYQKVYKEIISYKNVYYFNAILKEIQKDKSYDRIVISEELESFTHTQYEQIDKFIFDKLDSISDEASNSRGDDIPIILICSDRRTKSEQMLVKLFGIGVYNAILGNDRSIDEVCRLINKPRSKKEAKMYYKIDSDDVNYQAENENDVSEIEIQNIIAHYKKLGKNEDQYVRSFNNIAAQYNDIQLKIICKFLPLNVRAVLEEKSSKYQQVMAFSQSVSNELRQNKQQQSSGPSGKLLKTKDSVNVLSKPVVIPSAVNSNNVKKLTRQKVEENRPVINEKTLKQDISSNPYNNGFREIEDSKDEIKAETILEQPVVEQPKRGRGRPRKNPVPIQSEITEPVVPKKRGRPRKNPVQNTVAEPAILPGFDLENNNNTITQQPVQDYVEEEPSVLPGFDADYNQPIISEPASQNYEEEPSVLPGFDSDYDRPIMPEQPVQSYKEEPAILPGFDSNNYNDSIRAVNNDLYEKVDISRLLTPDKKIVSFVGTSKNGTSFIVNNLAEYMSSIGVKTAILDTTKNRNSYYIYTKNEEDLRKVAINSINGLVNGRTNGIMVNQNLTVYTALPTENEEINNTGAILETLVKNYSLVLIDCDFDTPIEYFRQSQEIYLIQSLDVLTIQPLTAFLRELKAKDILEQNKIKIILNKYVKVRGITEKTIIGGMAFYNDPAMSFMTELFDRNTVKYITIPFEEEIYTKYLESVINCNVSIRGYSKTFMQVLKELQNMVYPISLGKATYQPPTSGYSNNFSPSMNNTLNQMKRNY